jgi:hypothetical protein
MKANTATGVGLTCVVAYEAAAKMTGRPTVTTLSQRHPLLAWLLAGAWLAHVFWRAREAVTEVIEELEECDGWH